jgi:hypothetical protein
LIERITFPFNSGTASNVGSLSTTRRESSACNSSIHGYICGGYDGTNYISTIDRISFPFDSGTASNVGNLSTSNTNQTATDNIDFIGQFLYRY